MIKELRIFPTKRAGLLHGAQPQATAARPGCPLADFEATFQNGVVVSGKILEGVKGIRAWFKGIRFETAELKKEASNRILATYIINHCCSEY